MFAEYFNGISGLAVSGQANECSYRPALAELLKKLLPDFTVINEPKHIDCGAPDFVVVKDGEPVFYIETKDIGDSDLDGRTKNREQFDRYKAGLDNIIFTDYLDFRFCRRNSEPLALRIADFYGNEIKPAKPALPKFKELIANIANSEPQAISSVSALVKGMADKAKILRDVTLENLKDKTDDEADFQFDAFKKSLIHDISAEEYSSVYAQTITYGMFAARMYDDTPDTFSRREAAETIPGNNPFLRKMFQQIAGFDPKKQVAWIIDDLAALFKRADINALLENYSEDPILHLYEDFLYEYDPEEKKNLGVFYTPKPVVEYIVNSIDEILKRDFGLPEGLADSSKNDAGGLRVQILDPATGTGTFLVEIIENIYKKFASRQGVWQNYVDKNLIPRLNAFEIMMSPYTIAHIKVNEALRKTGYTIGKTEDAPHRLKIYLTNSLEEPENENVPMLWMPQLAIEANEANQIKKFDIMVICGNPPYSGESQNKNEWIESLISSYKKEPDSNNKLQEKNSKWINDDYVKFIRLGQNFIDRRGSGILAFINNHSFIDNPTFRGMRWSLMQTFDKIFILDLHGNNKKKETAPDGSKDENVFNIQQGVSINIFVKTGKSNNCEVHYNSLFGLRNAKFDYLEKHNILNTEWEKPVLQKPYYFFVPKDFSAQSEYDKRFKITDLCEINSVGIVTANDNLNISYGKEETERKLKDLLTMDEEHWRYKYKRLKDARDWKYIFAKEDAQKNHGNFENISYRPFDIRTTYYTEKTKGLYSFPRFRVMQHFIDHENVGLLIGRQGQVVGNTEWNLVFINKNISDFNMFYRGGELIFPLYLYSENGERRANLNPEILENFGFTADPLSVFDYIYAVLHSPKYRETYAEFLKIDFPRIPYPQSKDDFDRLAAIGSQLRKLHLLDFPETSDVGFPAEGSMQIDKIKYEGGRVWINSEQYFDGVAPDVWNFYVGGYQPMQQWLKMRKQDKYILTFDDVEHYRKMAYAIGGTIEIMRNLRD